MSGIGAALGGMVEGAAVALPQAFRDLAAQRESMQRTSIMNQQNDRENQKFAIEKPGLEAESAQKQALSAQTMQDMAAKQAEQKRRDTPVDLTKLPGDHAGINATIDYAKFTGRIQDGKPVTQGAIEDAMKDAHSNPEKIAPFYQKAWDETTAKVAAMKAPIAETQKELEEAQGRLQGPLTLAEKEKATKTVQKLQSQIAEANKGLEPLLKQQAETGQLLMEADKGAKIKQFVQDNKDTINGLPDAIQHAVKMNLSQGPDGITGAIGVMNKYAEEQGKLTNVKPPTGVEEFEMVTGMNASKRGTKEYQKQYLAWKKTEKQNVTINNGGLNLSPEATTALADRFGTTGELPGMGMGKAATQARAQVLNKWATDLKNTGQTATDQVARQASYKASVGELKSLQSQRGKVMAFANTADKNFDLVQQMSDKAGRTGVPVINRWVLAGKRSVAGDADVARFDASVRTAINEYAKVTSSATGGATTSDSARKEVESMLNACQTPEQVKGVIALLRQEVGNRKAGYDDQIKQINESIKGSNGGKPGAATSGGNLTGEHDGKSVTVSGKKYPLNPDGTVTINGKKYKVQ